MKKKLNCVLLVDDNESDNFFHKRVIEKSGITDLVEIATDGQEAIDFLIKKGIYGKSKNLYSQPELIFLDINMPVMNGWQFLEEYQKLEDIQKGKIIVIMLTTSVNPSDNRKAINLLGPDSFKFKPLTLVMINEIMQLHFPDYL
jgi:CheY-like chemotaxis protein